MVCVVKAIVFPILLWELDCKEDWTLKNWSSWAVVLEKTLQSPLDFKKIKPIHPKGNQSWIFIARTDAEAETPILWPPDVKNWLTGEKSWCWKRLKAGGEGENRGWDGWMASPTQWTWVWANSGSWWRTGSPGVPESIVSLRMDMTEQLNNSNKYLTSDSTKIGNEARKRNLHWKRNSF